MPDADPIVIKAVRRSRRIDLEDEHGHVQTFVAAEMSGPDRNAFRQDMTRRQKVRADGVREMSDFKDLEWSLISRTLTVNGQPVPKATVDGWAAAVLDKVFEVCQEVNGVGTEAEESVKNA